ncbi:hypothetical protein F751_2200 [Auxenochlorella protothecoides]|uniref:Uncharacterized protein n=1 Tax=Auxenochlorella protothecoides TaxID=3075 RepID=A0A087SLK9_AUXPR|nr:hypothetical protein F751_2200 [Auxenochlorella protothecoides]KFM26613.1 hypothetical protein F751_2200 [Auxenochlorella protothecoides]
MSGPVGAASHPPAMSVPACYNPVACGTAPRHALVYPAGCKESAYRRSTKWEGGSRCSMLRITHK